MLVQKISAIRIAENEIDDVRCLLFDDNGGDPDGNCWIVPASYLVEDEEYFESEIPLEVLRERLQPALEIHDYTQEFREAIDALPIYWMGNDSAEYAIAIPRAGHTLDSIENILSGIVPTEDEEE
jgi:hypothetical protein